MIVYRTFLLKIKATRSTWSRAHLFDGDRCASATTDLSRLIRRVLDPRGSS